MLYEIQAKIATIVGDIWASSKCIAIWPWPAVIWGCPEHKNSGADYRLFSSLLEPGDILLTTSAPYKGSNCGISGAFKHLIVYTGPVHGSLDEEHFIRKPKRINELELQPKSGYFKKSVTHAISEGVKCQDLFDIWLHYDYVAAIRVSNDKAKRDMIVEAALGEVGKVYDFSPSPNDVARYCTELGACCLKQANLPLPRQHQFITKMWKPWHKDPIYLADYFIELYDMICVTQSCNDLELCAYSLIPDIMRKKILDATDANA